MVQHVFRGNSGEVFLELSDKVDKDFILTNLIQPGGKFGELVLTYKSGPIFKVKHVHNNNTNLKLDFGGSLSTNVLSRNTHDRNSIGNAIDDQIGVFHQFVHKKLEEFFTSSEFDQHIKELEKLINNKLISFLGNTNKRIELKTVSTPYLHVQPILKDGNNEILPESISTGESVLLNLVFNLSTLMLDDFDLVAFDEPELHMHDDMIRIFFDEITQISKIHPDLIILVASHSTALIEYISSLGKGHVNLITFNNSREVKNSDDDIDFINALNRNGVWFSPLMLSKGKNIFIENQGKQGFEHRNFLLNFFVGAEVKPNIIPIGNSGNVNQNDSFLDVFEDILRTSDSKSIGIQDGDIWIKPHLTSYLGGDKSLADLMELLQSQKSQYIKGNRDNQFYFNFWEIENLYLMKELLPFWTKNSVPLSTETYKKILLLATDLIATQYFGTFLKKITRIRVENRNPDRMLENIRTQMSKVNQEISNLDQLKLRIKDLIKSLIENELWNWLPGKELKRHLENQGYLFDSSKIDFKGLNISNQLASVLYYTRPDQ